MEELTRYIHASWGCATELQQLKVEQPPPDDHPYHSATDIMASAQLHEGFPAGVDDQQKVPANHQQQTRERSKVFRKRCVLSPST